MAVSGSRNPDDRRSMVAASGSVEHGGTDPAVLIRVEILFDRIDVALIVLRLNARDLTLNV